MFELTGLFRSGYLPSVDTDNKRPLPGEYLDPGRRYEVVTIKGDWFILEGIDFPGKSVNSVYRDKSQIVCIVGEVWEKKPGLFKQLSAKDIAKEGNGTTLLQKVKGNFQIVRVDLVNKSVDVYNSRFGISPFYYSLNGKSILISNSLMGILKFFKDSKDIDYVSLLECELFNYPIMRRTLFKNISMLLPGEYIHWEKGKLQIKKYWSPRTLYENGLYSYDEALEVLSERLKEITNSYVGDANNIVMSITSGFDSRALLSLLRDKRDKIIGYSFGIPNSWNVRIPKTMCKFEGIRFVPIVLGKDYEDVFEKFALEALFFSDALSTVERANYPYAFRLMSEYSYFILTGIFGSELLRTFQNVGYILSGNISQLILNHKSISNDSIRLLLNSMRYLHKDLLEKYSEEIISDFNLMLEDGIELSPSKRFYLFMLKEGLRKYFGAEVHMERHYATNRFPFLDDDYVTLVFRAPFSGVYSKPLSPSIAQRYKSQFFYAYLIKKNYPELLKYPTDHGYPPKDVLFPLPHLIVGPKHLFNRIYRYFTKYKEFLTEEWEKNLYKKYLVNSKFAKEHYTEEFWEDFRSNNWQNNRLKFDKMASVAIYLDSIL